MYRIVASDMDETFLDENHRIPPANIEALRRMRELGVLFVPSSGRWYDSIMANFADVDPELLEGTYVISFNGGFINRFGDPEPLTSCGISYEVADALYRRGRELGMCMHVNLAKGGVYVCSAPRMESTYLESVHGVTYFDSEREEDLGFLKGRDIVKILYMSEDFEALHELGDSLEGFAAQMGCEITYSSGRYLEFMPAGIHKGTGLTRLAEMLGIPVEETIGLGDSANDLGMIEDAGLGVGVANVTDDVRPYCDVVLETTGPAGALPELVERFLEPGTQ